MATNHVTLSQLKMDRYCFSAIQWILISDSAPNVHPDPDSAESDFVVAT